MEKHLLWILAVFFAYPASSQPFEQLAEKPPMGWNDGIVSGY